MTVTSGRKAIYISINMTHRLMQASAQQGFFFFFFFLFFLFICHAQQCRSRPEKKVKQTQKKKAEVAFRALRLHAHR